MDLRLHQLLIPSSPVMVHKDTGQILKAAHDLEHGDVKRVWGIVLPHLLLIHWWTAISHNISFKRLGDMEVIVV